MKKRLLFLNNMAAPYQVKFCYALQEYYDAEVWFYTHLEKNRPNWWAIPLGDKCKVLAGSFFLPGLNYNNFGLLKEVKKFNPDIILAGGFFFPTHYLLMKWAKRNNVKYVGLGERVSFNNDGGLKDRFKKIIKKATVVLFRDIDLFMAMGEKPYQQMTEEFGFPKEKTVISRYPQDIETNLLHALRSTKDNPVLIFPNRLDHAYNPLFALEVFKEVRQKFPRATLRINEMGELKNACVEYIRQHGLDQAISFLEGIKAWDDLPEIYRNTDIALFTATNSNGPNTLIECMASGTGVVMSNRIFNTNVYARHEQNCFISDLDVNQFADYISLYILKEGLIAEHGSLSKKLVANRSVKATAKMYFEILEEKLYQ